MTPYDLSSTWVDFTVEGLGAFRGRLLRFLAPRTVDAIVKSLPLHGRVTRIQGGLYFQVGLRLGIEKARRQFRTGEIAYWPLSDAICLFNLEANLYTPANLVGQLENGLEVVEAVKSGRRISVVRQPLLGKP
ncbi:MAG: cyclophilin-like family protein [Candidatus Bathyarchaeia archaeon]